MANLIGFDKNRHNLEFKGHCKLTINFMSNYLYVEPQNEEFKLISASFEWNFATKKNLLFVFADFNFLDFCLEFKNEQMCKKILDFIYSGKKNKGITDPISIDTSFIYLILQKIADNLTLNSALIDVMAKWYQFLDDVDEEKYSNLMKEYGIYDMISAVIQNQSIPREQHNLEETNNRKRRFSQIKKEEILQDEMENKSAMKPSKINFKIILLTQFRLIHVSKLRRRTLLIFISDQMDSFHLFKSKSKNDGFKCITCEKKAIIDIDADGEICVKMESKEHFCKSSMKLPENSTKIKFIQKPNYEYFDNCTGKNRIIVFDSGDRSRCYEYSWNTAKSIFYCRGCCSKNIVYSDVSKANIRNEGTEKEYVECFTNHQCEKRKYSPEKYAPIYDYVLKPDFEIHTLIGKNGKEKQKLIMFDSHDRSKCYQYYYYLKRQIFCCCGCKNLKKWVTATLSQNFDNVQYVILSNAKHVCEQRPYVSNDKIILHQPQDFEIIGETKDGNLRIFLFAKNDRKKGYIFFKNQSSYMCSGCSSVNVSKRTKYANNGLKAVTGKLLKNEENGKYSFQIKSSQTHSCQPRPYQPEKYKNIPKTYDFFYYRLKNKTKTLKLALLSPENNQLCFTFVYQKRTLSFVCIVCRRMKKYCEIKPQKDADGKEYFNHYVKKHVCKPVKVSSISKSDILKESGIIFESKPKFQFDESKVIKLPNFELCSNKDGVPDRKLITFCSNDRTLCYVYSYDVTCKMFYCKKMQNKENLCFRKTPQK